MHLPQQPQGMMKQSSKEALFPTTIDEYNYQIKNKLDEAMHKVKYAYIAIYLIIWLLTLQMCKITVCNTVNVERFAGLNIHGFSPMKLSFECFYSALARSAHYLV